MLNFLLKWRNTFFVCSFMVSRHEKASSNSVCSLLRFFFAGLFDTLPTFCVKSLPKFDESLGPIDIDHLRELRNASFFRISAFSLK